MKARSRKSTHAMGIDHTKPRQANGCYCIEQHSSPRDIALAFAACRHPKGQQLQIDADGVATGYVKGTRGLVMCCHCGAHKRTSDGAWVHPHLVSSAIQAGRRCKRP
jgi:hypothetical protein